EEKAREMTIDLGFASLTLPNGESMGIIDVPGHRDFIGNMLSGIGGIDAVLLIIAADEGVSAQTREHLAILDLLDIQKGFVVLTKIDLVSEPEWIDLVELEAQEVLANTSLKDAKILRVSAITGEGIPELLQALQELVQDLPPKADLNRPRLPVDRVFSLTGFGTIVTGTLLDGSFAIGDEIVCMPDGRPGRIRGLQNHKHKLQKIAPGHRTAININGLDKEDIKRGDVITKPGTYTPTTRLDAHFRLIHDASKPLKHNTEVKVFIGSAETSAQLRLLGTEKLKQGESAFIQLKLDNPIIAARGDHYVLRLPSPAETIGGGVIIDPHPSRFYRRFDEDNLTRLQELHAGNESDLLVQALRSLGIATGSEIVQKSSLSENVVRNLLQNLVEEDRVFVLKASPTLNKTRLTLKENWQDLQYKAIEYITDFHQRQPLKAGITRENLRASLKLHQDNFDLIIEHLARQGDIKLMGHLIKHHDHTVVFTDEQEKQIAPLMAKFKSQPYAPPDRAETLNYIDETLLDGLIGSGRLVAVSENILLTPDTLKEMQDWVAATIKTNGSLTMAEFRDHYQNSRKYAQAILEYMDSLGFTIRKGDIRTLRIVQ
ncbi:MAG TPA: selenocysteine-specific translation elongation factor, partial [Anaerolineaceae bacterium]|nr:selenocysteine-specific translation elongation factor [Anaerolineaceae bacterium]